MKRTMRAATLAVVTTGLLAALATTAYATPGKTSSCTGCHGGPNVAVTATHVSTSGTAAKYNLSAPGANAIAVFSGSTKLTTLNASSGQVTLSTGTTYKIYAVKGPGEGDGVGSTTVTPAVATLKVPVNRISGTNQWGTAVAAAKRQFTTPPSTTPNYAGVTDIILASGDVKAQADPLSAAGLCWAYRTGAGNAPLLLVSAASRTDAQVLALIDAIVAANPGKTVTVRIVGGSASVPDLRYSEIANYVATHSRGSVAKERVLSTGGRYDLAAAIATRMKDRASASHTDTLVLPAEVLVANGTDPAKFFDPLALAPIAAYRGAPILLVSATTVPSATYKAIVKLRTANPATKVYVGGGTGTVSESVRLTLRGTRVSGADRYKNATAIANYAFTHGWLLRTKPAAVSATIMDAQVGGALAGGKGGALVLTPSTSLNAATSSWLSANMGTLPEVFVVGSTLNLTNPVKTAVINAVN